MPTLCVNHCGRIRCCSITAAATKTWIARRRAHSGVPGAAAAAAADWDQAISAAEKGGSGIANPDAAIATAAQARCTLGCEHADAFTARKLGTALTANHQAALSGEQQSALCS
jgi:hypothetical protein